MAHENAGLIIATHIDEYNGTNLMSDACLKELLNNKMIDAVQVVNSQI